MATYTIDTPALDAFLTEASTELVDTHIALTERGRKIRVTREDTDTLLRTIAILRGNLRLLEATLENLKP